MRGTFGTSTFERASWDRREHNRVVNDLLDDIERWRAAGERVAIARVIDIEGSGHA